jgi:hypothetical protein
MLLINIDHNLTDQNIVYNKGVSHHIANIESLSYLKKIS